MDYCNWILIGRYIIHSHIQSYLLHSEYVFEFTEAESVSNNKFISVP